MATVLVKSFTNMNREKYQNHLCLRKRSKLPISVKKIKTTNVSSLQSEHKIHCTFSQIKFRYITHYIPKYHSLHSKISKIFPYCSLSTVLNRITSIYVNVLRKFSYISVNKPYLRCSHKFHVFQCLAIHGHDGA